MNSPYIGFAADKSSPASPSIEIGIAFANLQRSVGELAKTLARSKMPAHGDQALTDNRLRSARIVMQIRDARDRMLGEDLFGDPAWNILLDAYANHLEGRRMFIGDICTASRAPDTTALRWIKVLEGRGLMTRKPDPLDKRRILVTLTPHALDSVESLIDETLRRMESLG